MTGTCVVTGGSRGIGRAVAVEMASAGRAVAVGFVSNPAAAESVVTLIKDGGGRAEAFQCDISREEDVVALFDAATRQLGPVNALVANAGIAHAGYCARFTAAELGRLFQVNVVGTMLCCREAVRRMGRRHAGAGGSIVAISSFAATMGGRKAVTAYAASKAAVDVFVTGLAREVASDGIRVNVVRPGVTVTDMTAGLHDEAGASAELARAIPLGRPAEPAEIAKAIGFLMSVDARYITGAHLDVSGGGFHFSQQS